MDCVSCTEITGANVMGAGILHLGGTFGCSRGSAGGCIPGCVVGTGSCSLVRAALSTDGALLAFVRYKD